MTYSMEAFLEMDDAYMAGLAAPAGSEEFAAARVRFEEATAAFWKGEKPECEIGVMEEEA